MLEPPALAPRPWQIFLIPTVLRIDLAKLCADNFVLSRLAPEMGTRWRREVNSNCRYRFLDCQTTASSLNYGGRAGAPTVLWCPRDNGQFVWPEEGKKMPEIGRSYLTPISFRRAQGGAE